MSGYVLYIYTRFQDGHEEAAKFFGSVEAALRYINLDRFIGDAYTFRIFELGREIPLAAADEEVPQPPKKKVVYRRKT